MAALSRRDGRCVPSSIPGRVQREKPLLAIPPKSISRTSLVNQITLEDESPTDSIVMESESDCGGVAGMQFPGLRAASTLTTCTTSVGTSSEESLGSSFASGRLSRSPSCTQSMLSLLGREPKDTQVAEWVDKHRDHFGVYFDSDFGSDRSDISEALDPSTWPEAPCFEFETTTEWNESFDVPLSSEAGCQTAPEVVVERCEAGCQTTGTFGDNAVMFELCAKVRGLQAVVEQVTAERNEFRKLCTDIVGLLGFDDSAGVCKPANLRSAAQLAFKELQSALSIVMPNESEKASSFCATEAADAGNSMSDRADELRAQVQRVTLKTVTALSMANDAIASDATPSSQLNMLRAAYWSGWATSAQELPSQGQKSRSKDSSSPIQLDAHSWRRAATIDMAAPSLVGPSSRQHGYIRA